MSSRQVLVSSSEPSGYSLFSRVPPDILCVRLFGPLQGTFSAARVPRSWFGTSQPAPS